MKPGDWWPCCYSANTSKADVLRLAAAKLKVPEDAVEVLRTEGAWLARGELPAEPEEENE